MRIVFLLIFIAIGITSYSQNNFARHWHIGYDLHLDFMAGNPTVSQGSEISSFESTVSHSDDQGNILFFSNLGTIYTGGSQGQIWNANNQVMPNGVLEDSCGCQSSFEGGIVIQDFNNPDEYHIYMTDCDENISNSPNDHIGISRTTIDMSLDNGLGDVTVKGEPIYGDSSLFISTGISATHHANGTDYWLVAHGHHTPVQSDTFYVFQISSTGISNPIKQEIGSADNNARIEISPDGSKLLYSDQLFDFDNSSGAISNPVDLPRFTYGKSFSPNSQLLYISDIKRLYQYDLAAANIPQSEVIIHESQDTLNPEFSALQLTPNCQIIVGTQGFYFGIIPYANNLGLSCGYLHNTINFFPGDQPLNFPNYIESQFACQTAIVQDQKKLNWQISMNHQLKKLNIEIPIDYLNKSFTIIDIQGRVIRDDYLVTEQSSVDVSSLTSGVYIIRIEGTNQTQKFYIL